MSVSGLVSSVVTGLPLKKIFQVLPGIWLLMLIPFAIYGPVYTPILYATYYTVLHVVFLINNSRSAYGMYVAYGAAKESSCTDWLQKYCKTTGTSSGSDTSHDMPFDHIVHLIILPNYKEEMDTLCETLDVLASHSRALTQYKVCLAMEESEMGSDEKAETLMRMYQDSFFQITYTIHPKERPGEIRGKSSNVAWATRQMAERYGGGIEGRHSHEIITVMDADTCFAEDYFSSITFYYCVASPEKRRIMMFAPSTVFDRNANNVPVFVRITDMFWSIGVISNLYATSPVKIPCSAYSVSMDLAIGVDFWDAGPEAIGEDLHMYLKCFFATRGRVIVQSIYSPASQCNVEGSGVGWEGWVNGLFARYTQAKRHLWGSLDTGYTLRRTLIGLFAPESESIIRLKNASVDKIGKEEIPQTFDTDTLGTLVMRLLEAHIVMGHLFTMITVAAIFLPVRTCISYELAAFMWSSISSEPMSPVVETALNSSFWLRLICFVPNIVMIYYYENYLQWTGFERWAIQEKMLREKGAGQRVDSACSLGDMADIHADKFVISSENQHLRVQPLGKRSSLVSARMYPKALLDWIFIPVAGFMFYVMPQFHAQLSHMFTDRLEYKVAVKPTIAKHPAAQHMHDMMQVVVENEEWHLPITKMDKSTSASSLVLAQKSREKSFDSKSVNSVSSKGDEGFCEDSDDF